MSNSRWSRLSDNASDRALEVLDLAIRFAWIDIRGFYDLQVRCAHSGYEIEPVLLERFLDLADLRLIPHPGSATSP